LSLYRLDTSTFADPVQLGLVRLRVMLLATLVGARGTRYVLTYHPTDLGRVHAATSHYILSTASRLEPAHGCERVTAPLTDAALASLLSPLQVAVTGEILNWEGFVIADDSRTILLVEEYGSIVLVDLSDDDRRLIGELGFGRWLIPA